MCDICGRGSCCESFHSLEEQQRYEKVIEAFVAIELTPNAELRGRPLADGPA